jgi:poly(glycerol-phosphate) alpha-glucosyltransferase
MAMGQQPGTPFTVWAMPATELPKGRYLSCAFRVAPDAGGQTRALLLRNRFFAEAGARPEIVTFGAAPDLAEREAELRERGLLADGVRMLNIYEHFRAHGWGDRPPTGEELPDLGAHRIAEDALPDGTPWRVTYRPPDEPRAIYDYLRPDGTPWLRIPAFGLAGGSSGRGTILQIGPDGAVVGSFPTARRWFRRWLRELARGQERTFAFMDSRYVVPHVAPLRARRLYLVYVMHNVHVQRPFRWDSETTLAYKRVLDRVNDVDAMVTLTERQRDDIAERRGRTTNMFVVPNPVAPAAAPAPEPPRDPHRVAVVARLEAQKRLGDAIAAFEQVVAAVPGARLDIYGDGSRRDDLQAEIDRRGLREHVTLRGFDPEAREALWRASAFLMTSSFEGYPLSTLESMSRGCPVVSYDIKYGPREQITDGVDGFLVPRGDVDALAGRVVELLRSPDLVARMSEAARATAASFGPEPFVARWSEVLRTAGRQRRKRTWIQHAGVETERLRVRRGRLQFAGVVTVRGETHAATLDSAEVMLAAIDDASGDVTPVGLKVERVEGEPRLRVRTAGGLLGGPRVPAGARLRLRVTWNNAAWETALEPGGAQPAPDAPPGREYAAA